MILSSKILGYTVGSGQQEAVYPMYTGYTLSDNLLLASLLGHGLVTQIATVNNHLMLA